MSFSTLFSAPQPADFRAADFGGSARAAHATYLLAVETHRLRCRGAAVLGVCLVLVGMLVALLTGCSGPDPSPGGTCVIGCSAVCGEGAETEACKTCILGCEQGEP